MRARSARSAVLAVAVALALTAAGPGHGLVDDDHSSTRGAQAAQPATGGAGPVPETSNLQPTPGIQPSETVPPGSTRDDRPPANGPALKGKPTAVVDTSDEGVKNLPVTRDRGTKNVPPTRDLGR